MASSEVVEVVTRAEARQRWEQRLELRREQRRQQRPPHPGLGIALVMLGIGAAAVALLGPLVLGLIDYHASAGAVAQIKGGDVAGLLLVAPVSIIAGVLVLRGHRRGAALGLGPAAYGLYLYFQLVIGGDPGRYPGNSERFFPLLLGLFVIAGFIIVRGWSEVDPPDPVDSVSPGINRFAAWFFLVVAAFLALGLHLPGLLGVWSGKPGSEYLSDPVVFWVVKMMDLGLVVPILLSVGVGLLRGRGWARRMRGPVAGWGALLGSSVAGMAFVMLASGDPAGSIVMTLAFGTFAVVALTLAVLVHRPRPASGSRYSIRGDSSLD